MSVRAPKVRMMVTVTVVMIATEPEVGPCEGD